MVMKHFWLKKAGAVQINVVKNDKQKGWLGCKWNLSFRNGELRVPCREPVWGLSGHVYCKIAATAISTAAGCKVLWHP